MKKVYIIFLLIFVATNMLAQQAPIYVDPTPENNHYYQADEPPPSFKIQGQGTTMVLYKFIFTNTQDGCTTANSLFLINNDNGNISPGQTREIKISQSTWNSMSGDYWMHVTWDNDLLPPYLGHLSCRKFTKAACEAPTDSPISNTPCGGAEIQETRPTLYWSPNGTNTSGTYYHIQLATDINFSNIVPGCETDEIGYNTSTWQILGTLNNNTIYYWRVRAERCSPRKPGKWSSPCQFTLNLPCKINDVSLTPSKSEYDAGVTITVKWTAERTTSFIIELIRNGDAIDNWNYDGKEGANSFDIALPSGNYTGCKIKVSSNDRACSASGNSFNIISDEQPDPPKNLTCSSSGKSITLNWDPSSSSNVYYEVARSIDNQNNWSIAANEITNNTWTDVNVTTDKTYYYKVLAYDRTSGIKSNYSKNSQCFIQKDDDFISLLNQFEAEVDKLSKLLSTNDEGINLLKAYFNNYSEGYDINELKNIISQLRTNPPSDKAKYTEAVNRSILAVQAVQECFGNQKNTGAREVALEYEKGVATILKAMASCAISIFNFEEKIKGGTVDEKNLREAINILSNNLNWLLSQLNFLLKVVNVNDNNSTNIIRMGNNIVNDIQYKGTVFGLSTATQSLFSLALDAVIPYVTGGFLANEYIPKTEYLVKNVIPYNTEKTDFSGSMGEAINKRNIPLTKVLRSVENYKNQYYWYEVYCAGADVISTSIAFLSAADPELVTKTAAMIASLEVKIATIVGGGIIAAQRYDFLMNNINQWYDGLIPEYTSIPTLLNTSINAGFNPGQFIYSNSLGSALTFNYAKLGNTLTSIDSITFQNDINYLLDARKSLLGNELKKLSYNWQRLSQSCFNVKNEIEKFISPLFGIKRGAFNNDSTLEKNLTTTYGEVSKLINLRRTIDLAIFNYICSNSVGIRDTAIDLIKDYMKNYSEKLKFLNINISQNAAKISLPSIIISKTIIKQSSDNKYNVKISLKNVGHDLNRVSRVSLNLIHDSVKCEALSDTTLNDFKSNREVDYIYKIQVNSKVKSIIGDITLSVDSSINYINLVNFNLDEANSVYPVSITNTKFLTIHPNPAEDEAMIGIDGLNPKPSQLAILNAIGVEIFKVKLSGLENDFPLRLSTSDFPPGVYFVTLQAGSYVETKKFVVIK